MYFLCTDFLESIRIIEKCVVGSAVSLSAVCYITRSQMQKINKLHFIEFVYKKTQHSAQYSHSQKFSDAGTLLTSTSLRISNLTI